MTLLKTILVSNCSSRLVHTAIQNLPPSLILRSGTGERGLALNASLGVPCRPLSNLKQTSNMADTDKVKFEDGDPQNVQDLTGFVPFDTQYLF